MALPSIVEYQHRVRRNCIRCMGNNRKAIAGCTDKKCAFWDLRNVIPSDQYNAFDEEYKRQFVACTLDTANEMPETFWFSDLRQKIESRFSGTPHPNWWGSMVPSALRKAGFCQSSVRRKSIRPSRRKGVEFLWMKKSKFASPINEV